MQEPFEGITEVPSGAHRLRVRVDHERHIPEACYDDHDVTVKVVIPEGGPWSQ